MEADEGKARQKSRLVIGLLTAALILVAGLITAFALKSQDNNENAATQSDAFRFASEYTKVPADNRFVYSNSEEVIDIFENGTGIVFLGFKECPWCQQLAPVINEAAEAESLDKIYYLDIRQSRQENSQSYQKLIDFLGDYLEKDADGNPRIYVPDVTAVVNGKITSRFQNEEDENATSPEAFWNNERYKRGVEQAREMIKEVQKTSANNNAILLDVRTAAEYNDFHFDKATNLDLEDIKRGELPVVDKNTKIYVYCRSGARAAQATALLKEAGFSNVENLGGVDDVRKNDCEFC